MTSDQLTAILAERMGWKVTPDRFIKSGRNWIPWWRFSPLTDLSHAFLVLEKTGARYTLTGDSDTNFAAHVRIDERIGTATGQSKPRVIISAVSRALGLEECQ